MAHSIASQMRIEDTRRELRSLQTEVACWVWKRQREDKLHQYQTQLNALEEVLFRALERIREGIDKLSALEPLSSVSPACRRWDKCLVLARRVWTFYRDKLDQRQDPRLRSVLAAADEVAWSCFAEVFRNARMEAIPSAPLPYLEPEYSPFAVPRGQVPADLRAVAGRDTDPLSEFLERLPIPVLGLPVSCVQAPWQLIYLGHEVGHHLQSDFVPGGALHELVHNHMMAALQEGALKAGWDAPTLLLTQARWTPWNQELFADAFSVISMGPSALHAMAELELAAPQEMLLRPASARLYPPALVRLAFLERLCKALNIDAQARLDVLGLSLPGPSDELEPNEDAELRAIVQRDLFCLEGLLRKFRQLDLSGYGTLEELCYWNAGEDFVATGLVEGWAKALVAAAPPFSEQSLRAPRLVAAAGIAARARLARVKDRAERKEHLHRLRERLFDTIVACREEGTRAADPGAPVELDSLGDELGELLVRTTASTVGG